MRYYLTLIALTLKIQAANIILVWDASITPNVSYNIYWSSTDSAYSYVINTTNLTITLNYNDTITNSWYLKSKSINGIESIASNIVTKYPVVQIPAPPTNLRITLLNGNKRDISWVVANNVNSVVEKAIESSVYSYVTTLPPGIMHWTDTKPKPKLTRYRIQACNQLCSTWSEITYIP